MKVVFETATLADAVGRAAKVAPTKGAGWDRARGIAIDVRPGSLDRITVRSTDTDLFYAQRVAALDVDVPDDVSWRLPSDLLARYVANLPNGVGERVTLLERDGHVYLRSGRSTAKLKLTYEPLMEWDWFSDDGMLVVPSFGMKFDQVSWAVDTGKSGVTAGIHIDGKCLYATDTTVGVRVECPIAVDQPITALLGPARSLLRAGDVKIKATKDLKLFLMPDPDTQLITTLVGGPFPNINPVIDREFPNWVQVDGKSFIDAVKRMLVLVKSDRYPRCKLTFKEGVLEIFMVMDEVGMMQEVVDLVTPHTGEPFSAEFTPDNLIASVQNAEVPIVTFLYHPGNKMYPLKVIADNGYQAVVMARTER